MKDYKYWKNIAREIQNGKVYEIYGPEALVAYIDHPIEEWWKLDKKAVKRINRKLKEDLGHKLKVRQVRVEYGNLRVFRMVFGKDTNPKKPSKPSIEETFHSADATTIQGDTLILVGKNLKV